MARLLLGQRGATQRTYCTADWLLDSSWEKTASVTARSNYHAGDLHKYKLNKGYSMDWYLILCSTCLYVASGRGVFRSPTLCSSLLQRQSCPIMRGGADKFCVVYPPCCSSLAQRQSHPIMKGKTDQLCSLTSASLLTVPDSVSSHTKARSRSVVQSILFVAPPCPIQKRGCDHVT